MAPNHHFRSSQPGPQPGAMPTGMERISIQQAPQRLPQAQIPPEQISPLLQTVEERAKPAVRQKARHVEEIYNLKQELSELQNEHDHVQDSMERMALDLDVAESELKVKDQKLKESEEELMALRKNVALFSAELDQEKQRRVKTEEKLLEQEKSAESQTVEMQQKTGSLSILLRGQAVLQNNNRKIARLQEEVMRLTSTLGTKDEELKNRDFVAAETEKRWTSQIQDQITHFQKKLQESNEFARVEIAKQEKLREAAEAALAAQSKLPSAAMEIEELRRRCTFYQNNSERLSKQIRMTVATNEQLLQSEQVKDHEIQRLLSLLRSQGYG